MRILTLVLGLLAIAGAAHTQEKGNSKSAFPEDALLYVEPARMVLIKALSESGVTADDTTHELDTMYVSLSDFENLPYNPSFNPPLYDPPPSFFDSLKFERIVFLPWSQHSRVHECDYVGIGYQKLRTCDSVRIYVEWKYIPANEKPRMLPDSRAAETTVVCQGKTWKIVNWRLVELM
jgi:hypothetical protein